MNGHNQPSGFFEYRILPQYGGPIGDFADLADFMSQLPSFVGWGLEDLAHCVEVLPEGSADWQNCDPGSNPETRLSKQQTAALRADHPVDWEIEYGLHPSFVVFENPGLEFEALILAGFLPSPEAVTLALKAYGLEAARECGPLLLPDAGTLREWRDAVDALSSTKVPSRGSEPEGLDPDLGQRVCDEVEPTW